MAHNEKPQRRFTDVAQMNRQQRAGTGFFPPPVSGLPLNRLEMTELIMRTAAKYSCSEAETKWLIKLAEAVLPENVHANQIRALVDFTQKGLKPDYQPVQSGALKKLK